MTDLIDVVQKQDPGSELVELFELVISSTSTIYLHSGVEADLSSVQFRDKTPTSGVYTARTYIAIPIKLTGISKQAEGASPRPSLTVANILNTFSSAIGVTNKDLVGKRFSRRTTLKKYLVGESADTVNTGPPIEFPTEKFIIDRISNEDKNAISFELTSATDLERVKLPGRIVVGKYCSWEYQGAGGDGNFRGGCHWSVTSQLALTAGTTTTNHKAYFTIDDEPIVLLGTSAVSGSGIANTVGTDYSSSTAYGINNWVRTGSSSNYIYWRSDSLSHTGNTPANNSSFWQRIRTYTVWTSSTGPYTYDSTEPIYVEYGNTIWRVVRDTPVGNIPASSSTYWVRGDLCGKLVNSCKSRFGFIPDTINATMSAPNKFPAAAKNTQAVLPFGGFPGSEKYR